MQMDVVNTAMKTCKSIVWSFEAETGIKAAVHMIADDVDPSLYLSVALFPPPCV